jgi:hypothetical protein
LFCSKSLGPFMQMQAPTYLSHVRYATSCLFPRAHFKNPKLFGNQRNQLSNSSNSLSKKSRPLCILSYRMALSVVK